MRFLLINSNPAVSRLINLSIEKLGYEIDEFDNDDLELEQKYDVTIVDNDSTSDDSISLLKEGNDLGKIIYIGARGCEKPDFADIILHKPFLPTDFVDMAKKLDTQETEIKDEEIQTENILDDDLANNDETLDLDELDSQDIPMPDDYGNSYEENKIDEVDETEEEDQKQEETLEDNDAELEEVEEVEEKGDMQADVSISILDSEDIDEVKQLLEEDDKAEETIEAETRDIAEDDFDLELPEDITEDLENNLEKEETVEPELMEEDKEEFVEDFGEVQAIEKDDKTEEVEKQETVEKEIIEAETRDIAEDDFDLELPEDITEDLENNLEKEETVEPEPELEEELEPELLDEELKEEVQEDDAVIESIPSIKEKSSIEDLNEDDMTGIFDDIPQPTSKENANEKIPNLENIQADLTQTISKDVKDILNKDEIKEALKGLKVNISISFDEE